MKQGRIKLLGTQFKEIEEELKKRDYSDVRTDKLIELKLQIYEKLIDEYLKVFSEKKKSELELLQDKIEAANERE